MPPGGMGGSGGMGESGMPGATAQQVEATEKKVASLVVTLEYPRNAPWLAGQPLPEGGQGAKVTLRVPVTEKKYAAFPLAVVDGAPLTVAEFREALRPVEQEEGEFVTVTDQNPAKLLERLIDGRVVVAEAREIGLDQLPEVRNLVEVFERQTLRENLLTKHLAGVKEDEKKVQELYREEIRESKIKAVLFDKEADAKAFAAALKAGGKFDALAAKAVADKKASLRGGAGGEYVRHQEMSPEMAKAIGKLKAGGVSTVVPADKQFALIQLLETRYPENPHAKANARERARNFAQNTSLVKYSKGLTEKYVKLDRKLFESLDFGKNMDTLLKDKRVVAEVKGGEPLTVAELADALKSKYYHGFQRAVDSGKIKEDKITTLNEALLKRAYLLEARVQRLDQAEEFKKAVQEYEESIIFGAFLQKVVVPETTLSMDDLRNYYKKNVKAYTTPEMLGIHSLVFNDAKNSQATLEQIQKGTDLHWLEANAPGQVAKGTEGVLDFGSNLITTSSLPAGARKSLEKVAAGNARLYTDAKGHHYVLYVEKVVPAQVQPFESVQEQVLKAVHAEKMQQALKEWTAKLRKSYPVEIFVKEFNQAKL
jgi:parvulin-like peptidyl-prolyl isomerase